MPKRIGFFRELDGYTDGPSLRDAVRSEPQADEENLARYLAAASVLATTGHQVHDVLDPGRERVAPEAVLTDGEFVWPADLAYYVATYHVVVPDDLVAGARARSWSPPDLSPQEMVRVEDEFLG
jgi:hypothetical protein